jgi:hypothetical protein
MLRMQTLGLADSSTRTESRLKSLFWPSIQSGADVDYLGAQGYWVCTVVALFSLAFLLLRGQLLAPIAIFLFFYLGGAGVRERSRFAAAMVFLLYGAGTAESIVFMAVGSPWGMIVLRVAITALLLSNLRATWIASEWKADSEEAVMPSRLAETWSDKVADRWPMWLWPKVRWGYYVLAPCMLLMFIVGFVMTIVRGVVGF